MKQENENFMHVTLSKDWVCLSILFLFVFLVISPIIYFGIPNGYDLPQHYQFAFTYFEAFKSGNFLPGWSAFENYGYGGIGIRIYPPLAHYLLAFTQLFANDWFTTSWINFLFWLSLGSLGIYLLAREWMSPLNSLFVGMLYAVAPYHLSQLYQAFLYSEFTAAGILPFCFLFITRVCRQHKFKDAIFLGLSLSFLIISHIPTTLIGVISLAIYTIFIIDWKNFKNIFSKLFLGGVIALLSTSFYWLKLITELKLVNHSDSKYSSGLYSYKLSFFPMIFNPSDLYFIKQMWLSDLTASITIIFLLPFTIFVILKFIRYNTSNTIESDLKEYLAMILTGSFAFLMASSFSSLIWENVSFIQKIQFPFRWLSVATLFASLTFILAISKISYPNKIIKIIKQYSLILLFLGLFIFDLSQIMLPSETLSRAFFEEKLDGLIEKESYECWWTIWSNPQAFEIKEKVTAQNRQVNITTWQSQRREFEVENGEPTTVRIATFYYPHWQGAVNGENVQIERDKDGTILIPLTKDKSNIQLRFVEPLYLKIAKYISFISWSVLILISLFFLAQSFLKSKDDNSN